MSDLSTPRPWKNDRYGFLCGANGKGVEVWGLGIAHSMRDETTEANAELIVKAVNSYDDLVKWGTDAAEIVDGYIKICKIKQLPCDAAGVVLENLREVLARGEKAVR